MQAKYTKQLNGDIEKDICFFFTLTIYLVTAFLAFRLLLMPSPVQIICGLNITMSGLLWRESYSWKSGPGMNHEDDFSLPSLWILRHYAIILLLQSVERGEILFYSKIFILEVKHQH